MWFLQVVEFKLLENKKWPKNNGFVSQKRGIYEGSRFDAWGARSAKTSRLVSSTISKLVFIRWDLSRKKGKRNVARKQKVTKDKRGLFELIRQRLGRA